MKKLFVLAIPLILVACNNKPSTETVYLSNIQLDPFTELPLPEPNNQMPTFYMQLPKLLGTKTLNVIKPTPYNETSYCYGTYTGYTLSGIDKQYQYDGWSLLNTLGNNFYWTNQTSAGSYKYTTNFLESVSNANFDLGYYTKFIVDTNKKCAG